MQSTDVPALVLWAPVISAAGVLLVGFFGGYIAFRQWLTARAKVQLDLFDRRKPAYDAVADLLADVTVIGTPTNSDMVAFARKTADAQFLFGPDIAEYISDIQRRAANMSADERLLTTMKTGAERDAAVRRRLDDLDWFKSQYGIFDDKFRPYLQIEGRKVKLPEVAVAVGEVAAKSATKVISAKIGL